MASLQTIREAGYRFRSEGADKLAADINKVSAASEKLVDSNEAVAKATETVTKRQLSAGTAYERLLGQIDPAFRAQQAMARGQATLDRAQAQGKISADEYAASMTKLQARFGQMGAANNNLVGQTGNLAAQFNDIGVQLAGGQSPFLIALQQGTQISQVLGEAPGGAGGAVKALGGAFMSLISPVNLATIAAIALGGAAIQYFTSTDDKLQSLDDKLKAHADLIKDIKDAYGEAAKGIDEYAAKSGAVLEQQLRASMDRLREELEKQSKAIARSTMESPTITPFNPTSGIIESDLDSVDQVKVKYEAFADAIARLRGGMKAGNPDIRAFQSAIAAAMAQAGDDKELRKFGDQLIARSEDALKIEESLKKAERAIRVVSGAAGDGVDDLKTFGDALKALQNIALPNLTEQEKALQEYRKAVAAADDAVARSAALSAYNAAITRANQRDAEKAAEEARKDAEREAEQAARKAEADQRRLDNIWSQSVNRVQDQTRALEQQATTYGQSAGEIARYRAEQELLNAAMESGRELTPGLRAQIAAMAEQAGGAAQRMSDLQSAIDWSDVSGDALKGFVSDLRSGKDAGEAFLNVLEKIADKLLDMSIDWMLGKGPNPFSSIMGMFGGGSASGGGALAGGGQRSMPNMAQGGYGPDVPSLAFQGMGKLPEVISSAVAPLKTAATSVGSSLTAAAQAIRTIESGSAGGNYGALGVLTKSGDRAYGAYQVMGNNVGPWSKQHFGQRLTPSEFLGNREAQDAVFNGEFGRLMQKYGPEGASRAWFAGEGGMKNWGARDANGTSVGGYNSRFGDLYQRYNNGPQALNGSAGNDNLAGGIGTDAKELSGNFDKLSQSMNTATPQITQGLTGLSNVTQQGGQAVGGALKETAGTIGEGANGIGASIQQLMQALSKSGGGGIGGLLGLFSKGGGDWSNTSSWTIGSSMDGVSFLPNAKGNVFDGSKGLSAYSNGIVDKPTFFAFAKGAGLMGEAGPEAIMPLTRDSAGRLGVRTQTGLSPEDVAAIRRGGSTGGGIVVNNNVVNQSGAQVKTETRQNEDGSIDIMTIIDDRAKGAVRKDAARNGSLSRQLGVGFNGRG